MASLDKIQIGISILEKGFKILDIPITFHCNLNCSYCGAMSPFSDKYFVSSENFTKNIKKLAELVPPEKFKFIHIVGGEPLLHPDINIFLEQSRKTYPTKKIELVTNGLLLDKMDDSFKKCVYDNKIDICISDYGIIKNKDSLKNKYADYGLSLKFSEKKTFNHFTYDLEGKQDKNQSLEYCRYCECLTLIEDKFYLCGTDFFIRRNLGPYVKTDMSSEDSGENIYDNNNYYELISKLIDKFPIDSCKFCKFPIEEIEWKNCTKPSIENYI